MKETQILFKAEMVRAVLEGRKTQTRRVVKPQPLWVADPCVPFKTTDADPKGIIKCPYGQVGDRLWVRETWALYQPVLHIVCPDGRSYTEIHDGSVAYRADGWEDIEALRSFLKIDYGTACEAIEIDKDRWKPSIHMPRWASRIDLEITGIRCERLQEISEADAIAEGVRPTCWFQPDPRDESKDYTLAEGYLEDPERNPCCSRNAFANLWNSLSVKEYDWIANPWVWVVEFKKI